MEIITGVERRRRWRLEEKLRIVAETERPGACFAEIARRYEVSRGLLWNWRSQVHRGVLAQQPTPTFVPMRMMAEPDAAAPTKHSAMGPSLDAGLTGDGKVEITLPDGTGIRIGRDVSLVTLRRVMSVLRG
jgi:transposase-like protein